MQHTFADSCMRLQDVPILFGDRFDDLASERAVLFHQIVFVQSELAWFEQDRIGDSNFSDVVQLCCLLQHFQSICRIPHLPRDNRRVATNPNHMVTRVVVPLFCGASQAQNELLPCGFQLACAAFDLLFEASCFTRCHIVVFLDHYRVANTGKKFVWVDRLL